MADTTTTTYAFTKPEVGASENTWGAKLSANWDKADDLLDGTTAIAPNLTAGTWEVGGVAVTATAAELNLLDGVTEATVANYRDNTASAFLTTDIVWAAMAEVSLSDGASIAWDMDTGIDFTVTLGGNRALANATNTQVGKKGRIRVVQDGTGSRTLTFGTSYEFARGTAPTLTTTIAAEDILYYDCISATRILISSILDIS